MKCILHIYKHRDKMRECVRNCVCERKSVWGGGVDMHTYTHITITNTYTNTNTAAYSPCIQHPLCSGIYVGQFLFIVGLKLTTANIAAIYQPLCPVFTVLVALALRMEKFTYAKLVGIVLAVSGS